MLTCDAFGVMPPVSKLTHEQAMYHFLSGYTAKVAGTERGVNEPSATFSACFGAPFMARPPGVYASMLGESIQKHNVDCWLVNTGWSGGGFGVGERMDIGVTRAIVRAVLDGSLAKAECRTDPMWRLDIPTSCEGVPAEILDPRNTWADKDAYEKQVQDLIVLFRQNFAKFTDEDAVDISKHGP
jgi:phosphoenolpyruvate carboxykinase (ATP)